LNFLFEFLKIHTKLIIIILIRKNYHTRLIIYIIKVLVFACNRPNAVEDHLNELLDRRSNSNYEEEFPIIISQDCNHQPTTDLINRYSDKLFAHLKVLEIKYFYINILKSISNLPSKATRSIRYCNRSKWQIYRKPFKRIF
jgi:hypothetical protein